MAKQDDFARYTIRIPQSLYDQIVKAAEERGRSINAEITYRLDRSLNAPVVGALTQHATEAQFSDMVQKVETILQQIERQELRLIEREREVKEREAKLERKP